MATATIDIMARLTAHMRAAELAKGEPVTKSDAFYGGLLESTPREEIGQYLKGHGFTFEMGRGSLGQLWLIVKKSGGSN